MYSLYLFQLFVPKLSPQFSHVTQLCMGVILLDLHRILLLPYPPVF